jgi:hypothetical protein
MVEQTGAGTRTSSYAKKILTRRGLVGISAFMAAGLASFTAGREAEATHGAGADLTALHVGQDNPATARTRLSGAVNAGGTTGILDISNTAGIGISVDVGNSGAVGIRANSNTSAAVQAFSTSNVGVAGNSTTNFGVVGTSNAVPGVSGTSVQSAGLAGNSTNSAGVFGISTNGIGLQGLVNAPNGSPAVVGQATGGQIGVQGQSNTGRGIQGVSNSGPGVEASSQTSVGVNAFAAGSQAGVAATSVSGPGVSAASTNGNALVGTSTNGLGLFASTARAESPDVNNPTNFAARIEGGDGLIVVGTLRVTGQKMAYVLMGDGSARQMFCVEATVPYFEDFGAARLQGGFAAVSIDQDFAELIVTEGYFINITPLGPSNGLFVSRITSNGFEVRENGGGTSTVDFFWRVAGRRKDVEGTYRRLERMAAPSSPRQIVESQPRVRTADELPRAEPPRIPAGVEGVRER